MGILKRTGNTVLTRILVIAFVISFLIFFFDNVQTTYNSYKDLEKAIENSKIIWSNWLSLGMVMLARVAFCYDSLRAISLLVIVISPPSVSIRICISKVHFSIHKFCYQLNLQSIKFWTKFWQLLFILAGIDFKIKTIAVGE